MPSCLPDMNGGVHSIRSWVGRIDRRFYPPFSGVPGRPARAIRRFGMAAIERITPLKNYFMAEARGEAGQLPRLLQGMTV